MASIIVDATPRDTTSGGPTSAYHRHSTPRTPQPSSGAPRRLAGRSRHGVIPQQDSANQNWPVVLYHAEVPGHFGLHRRRCLLPVVKPPLGIALPVTPFYEQVWGPRPSRFLENLIPSRNT